MTVCEGTGDSTVQLETARCARNSSSVRPGLTDCSIKSAAASRVFSSASLNPPSASAKSRVRRCLACCNKPRPLSVAVTRIRRASFASVSIFTNPSRFKPATIRLIVGAFTCSTTASCPRAIGPPNTSTDRADNRAGPCPALVSCCRAWRNR